MSPFEFIRMTPDALRIGTRGSALALAQAELVAARWHNLSTGIVSDRVTIKTQGDADKTSPLAIIGGQGVFTSALQDALTRNEIDAAVHSAKDLPSAEHPSLELSAFLAREDPRDVLITRWGTSLDDLPPRARIGTSSRRRMVLLRIARSDLEIVDIRGNIDTRMRRALDGDLDAVILAAAGLKRMGWEDRIAAYLPVDQFIPAPGQAALAIETRRDDAGPAANIARLDEPSVSVAVRVERAFLRAIGAGCTTPVGAHAIVEDMHIQLWSMLASDDLRRVEWGSERLALNDAEDRAAEIARTMLGRVAPERSVFAVNGNTRPLAGVTVLVTRASLQAAELSDALTAVGAEPVLAPTLRIAPADAGPIDVALDQLSDGQFDWAVFTSTNAIDAVLDRLGPADITVEAFKRTRIVAVGPATARRLVAAGIRVALVPEVNTAKGALAALSAQGLAGRHVWLPQGNIARDILSRGLAGAGALTTVTEAYRTEQPDSLDPDVQGRIAAGEIAVATFTSPSTVRNLAALLGGSLQSLQGAIIVCVGPTTAAAVWEHGLLVNAVAQEPTTAAIVQAVVTAIAETPATRG